MVFLEKKNKKECGRESSPETLEKKNTSVEISDEMEAHERNNYRISQTE